MRKSLNGRDMQQQITRVTKDLGLVSTIFLSNVTIHTWSGAICMLMLVTIVFQTTSSKLLGKLKQLTYGAFADQQNEYFICF